MDCKEVIVEIRKAPYGTLASYAMGVAQALHPGWHSVSGEVLAPSLAGYQRVKVQMTK